MTAAEHSALLRAIMAKYSNGHTRLFITNSGEAYQGTVISQTATTITLLYPRRIHFGVKGMADLNGITQGGRYVAIEAKTGSGKLTKDQEAFLRMVKAHGGKSGVARSIEDAGEILSEGSKS